MTTRTDNKPQPTNPPTTTRHKRSKGPSLGTSRKLPLSSRFQGATLETGGRQVEAGDGLDWLDKITLKFIAAFYILISPISWIAKRIANIKFTQTLKAQFSRFTSVVLLPVAVVVLDFISLILDKSSAFIIRIMNINRHTRKLSRHYGHRGVKRFSANTMRLALAVFLFTLIVPLINPRPLHATTDNVFPNGDITTGWANTTGTSYYTEIDDAIGSYSNLTKVSTGLSGTDGEIVEFDMGQAAGASYTVTSVQLYFRAWANGGCQPVTGDCDTLTIDVSIDGAYTGSPNTYTLPESEPGSDHSSYTWNGTWTGDDDLKLKFTRNRIGGGGPSGRDDDATLSRAYIVVTYTVPTDVQQTHFRWRDDTTALDTDGGWQATEDNNTIGDISKGVTQRLRIEAANNSSTDAANSWNYRLEYGTKGATCSAATGWTRIDTASDAFEMVASTHMTDGESLDTTRLTASETTFVAGEGRDVTDESGATSLAVDEYTEMEYSFRATSSATDGETYCFRMTDGGSVMDAYNVYPEATLSTPPPNPLLTQEGYVFENEDGSGGSYSTDLDFPGTGSTLPRSGNNGGWTNASNITSLGSDSTAVFAISTGYTDYLRGYNYGFSIPTNATIDGIEVDIEKRGNAPDIISDDAVRIYKTVIGSTDKSKSGYWSNADSVYTYGGPTDLWGETWTASDINNLTFGAVISADTISTGTAYVEYIKIKVYYTYGADSSVQAGTKFTTGKTLSSVRQGESITLRTQLTNTGASVVDTDELALFYDRNDGNWTKVGYQEPKDISIGNCTDTDFTCEEIDDTGTDRGENSSIAVDPSGRIWISYIDATNENLMVARYVGSGGSGCTSSAWNCETVSLFAKSVGEMVINDSGKVFVVYHYQSGANDSELSIAEYVGSGGSGCTSSAWTCIDIDISIGNGNSLGANASIALDTSGNPWVAYAGPNNSGLNVASYDGSWSTSSVESTASAGVHQSIAFSPSGVPWVSYYNATNGSLEVAIMNGSGSGSCNANSDWNCEVVDDVGATSGVGQYSSIAFSTEGKAWIGYYDVDNTNAKVAERVESGGSGCTGADNSTLWNCGNIDSGGTTGEYASLSFAPDGNPWVSYYDAGNTALKLVKYNGASWSSATVDNSGSDAVGQETSLAFDPSGNALISYYDGGTETSLAFAQIKRAGELLIAPSLSGTAGDSLTESHVDMTSSTDTTNRDDADCIASGANWNNGTFMEAENGSGLVLGAGNATAQCTELSWKIDTSQATPGETYRFVVATKDAWRPDKGSWRGPISVATDAYPTITIASDEESTYRYSKDTMHVLGTESGLSSGPNSPSASSTNGSGNNWSSITNAYSSDNSDTTVQYPDFITRATDNLLLTNYGFSIPSQATITGIVVAIEGSCEGTSTYCFLGHNAQLIKGGTATGDNDARLFSFSTESTIDYGGTSDLWGLTLTPADVNASDFGVELSVYNDDKGEPSNGDNWEVDHVAITIHYTNTHSCTDTDWTCETIDAENTEVAGAGLWSSMGMSPEGETWISYRDVNNLDLMVARYVGSGGTGCSTGTTAWDCMTVDSTNSVGAYTSLAFAKDGKPWVSYGYSTDRDIRVASYVGGGNGTGCADTDWTCETVATTNFIVEGSLAIDHGGTPWITYRDATATEIWVAHRVGGGNGTGCADNDWSCEKVEDADGGAAVISMTEAGAPLIAMEDLANSNLEVIRYVGSGGSGCGTGVSTAWNCTDVYTTSVQTAMGITNNSSGNPVVTFNVSGGAAWSAEYVGGTGGTGCAVTDWTCVKVVTDSVDDESTHISATDAEGNIWFTYSQTTNDDLYVAHQVGSGGNCDTVGSASGSDAWQCDKIMDISVDDGTYTSQFSSMAFDQSGSLWISYYDRGDGTCDSTDECGLNIAKQKLSTSAPVREVANAYNGRNAGTSQLSYMLSSGLAPYTDPYGDCGGVANMLGYCGLYTSDGQMDSISAEANERPIYQFSTKYSSTSELPTANISFQTDTSPATNNVVLQAYRYGTTNAWETVSTYSTAGCSTENCVVKAHPSGTASEYYETDGSDYWVHYRLYQVESSSASITLSLDQFTAHKPQSILRGGRVFRENLSDPLAGW